MNDLKDAFDLLAEQAPHPDDQLANRALRSGQRRRRTRMVMLPAVGAAAFAIAIGGYLTVNPPFANEQVYGNPPPASGTWLVDLPTDVPDPLPSKPVGPVDMAYRVMCDDHEEFEDDKAPCRQWRLWNADGSTWRVDDVYFGDEYARTPGLDNLMLSPDGSMIAYPRASDQSIVVRDLTTGKSRVVADDGERRPEGWSRNGRWLVLDVGTAVPNTQQAPKAQVVDTETWKTTTLPDRGAIMGIPDRAEPVPAYPDEDGNGGKLVELWDRDGSGGSSIEAMDPWFTSATISPNGEQLAYVSESTLDVFDTDDGTRNRIRFDEIDGELETGTELGWYDNHTVLAVPSNDAETKDLVFGLNLETEEARELIRFVGLVPEGPDDFSLATARLADARE